MFVMMMSMSPSQTPKFIQIHSYDKDIMTLMSTLTLFRDMGELDEVASLAERGALMYRQVGIALGWC